MKERSQKKPSSRKKSRKALGRRTVGQAAMRKRSRKAVRQPSKRITELSQAVETQRIQAYEQPRLAVPARHVRVVAMGDSWFHYFPAWDILSQLRTENWGDRLYDVEDTAKAGATLNEMVYGRTIADTYQLLHQHPGTEVFLFSGGGNDVTNDQMLDLLYNRKAIDNINGTPEINKKVMQGLVGEVFYKAFDDLIGLLRYKMTQIGKPNMPIIFHGYDYPFPDGRGWSLGGLHSWVGPWLDPPLTYKGYDRTTDSTMRLKIVHDLIDAFNDMLASVVSAHPNTYYVNLRGTLTTRAQWHNELHPKEPGFNLITKKIEAQIRAVV
jgi:lysophospholipase L1-like esterase